jgi:hypothetical protein
MQSASMSDMALDVRAHAAADPRAEEAEVDRTLGGNMFVWLAGLVLGLGLFLLGVSQAPQTGGFLLMIASGLLAGVSYAELMLRMPAVTHRFTLSVVLTLVVLAVVVVGALLFSQSLPTPTPNPDINLLPAQG